MTDIKSLAKRYNFSDFTEKHYITLIKLAKKKYLFEPFTTKTEEPHVLWRHDVDSSVHRALKLAKIEKKLGVKSTYFLRLHSEWYNLFEKEVYDKNPKKSCGYPGMNGGYFNNPNLQFGVNCYGEKRKARSDEIEKYPDFSKYNFNEVAIANEYDDLDINEFNNDKHKWSKYN